MSFAGGRRANKVKKGVQFTVMVVGTSQRPAFLWRKATRAGVDNLLIH